MLSIPDSGEIDGYQLPAIPYYTPNVAATKGKALDLEGHGIFAQNAHILASSREMNKGSKQQISARNLNRINRRTSAQNVHVEKEVKRRISPLNLDQIVEDNQEMYDTAHKNNMQSSILSNLNPPRQSPR